jgi:hypothetical protein
MALGTQGKLPQQLCFMVGSLEYINYGEFVVSML